jgi:hypothetical protein
MCRRERGANTLRIAREIKRRAQTVHPRRGIQAEYLSLRLPGSGQSRAGMPGMASKVDRSEGCNRCARSGPLELVPNIPIASISIAHMPNFSLLREVGRASKPVLLKRGLLRVQGDPHERRVHSRRKATSRTYSTCERGPSGKTSEQRFTLEPCCGSPTHRARNTCR